MSELTKQLRIKAGMINLGERIEWGSETALMDTAANRIDHLEAELARLRAVPDIAGWLWHWLMDYCKKNSQPPATRNDLFAVVSDLRKMLAAAPSAPATLPSVNQQLLEGLEVVAYECLSGFHVSLSYEPFGDNPVPLWRAPDAQRALAELRTERDNLRQQLAERDAEIERLRVKLMIIASAEPGRHNIEWAKAMAATGNNESYAKWREAFDQRDKLAGLLRDERNWSCVEISCQRGVKDHCLCGTCRILRIDAALAEVNK